MILFLYTFCDSATKNVYGWITYTLSIPAFHVNMLKFVQINLLLFPTNTPITRHTVYMYMPMIGICSPVAELNRWLGT